MHITDHFKPLYYLLSLLPIISLGFGFFNIQIAILSFLSSVMLNFIISLRFNHIVSNDIDSLFYTGRTIQTAQKLSKIEMTPDFHYNLTHLNRVNRWRFLLIKAKTIPGYFLLLIKYMFLVDLHLHHVLVQRFQQHDETIHACYRYVGDIDTQLSIKHWRYHHGLCTTPIVSDSVKVDGLTHPLIEEAVPNHFIFTNNVLLTGSNASGKSTFMKALAINLILAQAIQTVTAASFQYQPGIVKSTMANADDVLLGDSYFMAEIKSLHRLMAISEARAHYYFVDEIFKGTNTTERIAASNAVLRHFSNYSNVHVIAATHDIELTTQLDEHYDNFHFNEVIQNDEIHFDYKIKPGAANTRNALELIRITGFPTSIYHNAKTFVQQMEENEATP